MKINTYPISVKTFIRNQEKNLLDKQVEIKFHDCGMGDEEDTPYYEFFFVEKIETHIFGFNITLKQKANICYVEVYENFCLVYSRELFDKLILPILVECEKATEEEFKVSYVRE